jgi:multiple sugar transport system permease protein
MSITPNTKAEQARRSLSGVAYSRQRTIFKWAMLTPTLIILLALTAYPTVYMFWTSLHAWNLSKPRYGYVWVGLQNFIDAFKDARFLNSVQISLVFVLLAVAFELLIGLGLALLLNRSQWWVSPIRLLLLLPMMVTPIVLGLIFLMMYNGNFGVINYFLTLIGLQKHAFLADPGTALAAIIVADVWQWTPFVMLIFMAGLAAFPGEVMEAARTDCVSWFQEFWYVTLPLLKPVILVALLIRTIDAFRLFDLVYVMTKGGPGTATETLTTYIYVQGFDKFEMGYASALAILMLVVVNIVAQFLIRSIYVEESAK